MQKEVSSQNRGAQIPNIPILSVQKSYSLFLYRKKIEFINNESLVDQSAKGTNSLIMQTYQLAKETIKYQNMMS